MNAPAPAGWPFLVARGRRRGYAVLLAPHWLVAEGGHGLLEDAVGPVDGPARHRVGTLPGRRRLSLVWAEHGVTGDDVGEAAAPRDEHSRPLRLLYGFLSADAAVREPAAADLAHSRAAALATYRRFLADEESFAVEVSEPFALASKASPTPPPPQGPSRPPPSRSAQPYRSRPLPAPDPAWPQSPSRRTEPQPAMAGGRRARLAVPVLSGLLATVLVGGGAFWLAGSAQPPAPQGPSPSSQVRVQTTAPGAATTTPKAATTTPTAPTTRARARTTTSAVPTTAAGIARAPAGAAQP